MARSSGSLLKTYAVFAVGPEGVPFKLVETFWYRRAAGVFNAAKDSGRWTMVHVMLGDRVCMTYRMNPERRSRAPQPAGGAPPPAQPMAPQHRRIG